MRVTYDITYRMVNYLKKSQDISVYIIILCKNFSLLKYNFLLSGSFMSTYHVEQISTKLSRVS